MTLFATIALILVVVGGIWFAYEVWQREDLIWALAIIFVPFPLLGAYLWYRSGWDSCYRIPSTMYFAGYFMAFIVNFTH